MSQEPSLQAQGPESLSVEVPAKDQISKNPWKQGASPTINWVFDVQELKQQISDTLDDVIAKDGFSEYVNWIRDTMDAKKKSIVVSQMVLWANGKEQEQQDKLWALFELIYTAKVINSQQVRRGFDRLYRIQGLQEVQTLVLEFLHSAIDHGMMQMRHFLRIPVSLHNQEALGELVVDQVDYGNVMRNLQQEKQRIINLINEYYVSGSSEDLLHYLQQNQFYAHLVIRKSVELALEAHNQQKQYCSRLLAELSGKMDPAYYIEAFDDLLWHINEFRIDSPGAEKTLARFIARAIIDECLPATYLADSELMEFLEDSYEHQVLKEAQSLLNTPECYTLLLNVWGPRIEELQDLKDQFDIILKEFFDSQDAQNVLQCIREMACPSYMHQFIKRGIELIMDRSEENEQPFCTLIKTLILHGVLSESQLNQGLQRIEDKLDEIVLDVPRAKEIFTRFSDRLANS